MTPAELEALADWTRDYNESIRIDYGVLEMADKLDGIEQALRQYAKEKPYVQHQWMCDRFANTAKDRIEYDEGQPCTCGLDEVRSDE